MKQIFLLLLSCLFLATAAWAQKVDEAWIQENYTKKEVFIPMRDGLALYTAIYEPKTTKIASPVIITRTPYRNSPYGPNMSPKLWNQLKNYARENYIFVFQDVRGTGKSEGEFQHIRPFNANKHKKLDTNKQTKQDIDEASDTYDTADWLLKQLPQMNGNMALIGSSYPGFYAMMGGLSGHPAIKAIVPQAPVADWFMGDDVHHNGALMLTDAFRFLTGMEKNLRYGMQSFVPTTYYTTDEYSFFLQKGALRNITALLQDSIPFWNEIMAHPNYDEWWKARRILNFCFDIKPAVLVVGGLFDAEDCYGAWALYRSIQEQSPSTPLSLAMGPWWHGGWNHATAKSFGNLYFGSNTAEYYRDKIEFPFIQSYLKPSNTPDPPRVDYYLTGENVWKECASWPPQNAQETPFYFQSNSRLSTDAPTVNQASTSYVSDPSSPVPYAAKFGIKRQKEYMIEDQKFVEGRQDVISFSTDVLTQDIRVTGAPKVELYISSTTTDADFIVKIIDQYPAQEDCAKRADFAKPADSTEQENSPGQENSSRQGKSSSMKDYYLLVRGDVMRARFRNSFEHPEALVPGEITRVSFTMPDISHTFKKGHRIRIQVQSSWFPLVDRNPQQFVDIHTCSDSDFIPATLKLFHQKNAPSKVILPLQ